MIIISQDETRLVNFDKVEILGIDIQNNKQICCGFHQGNLILGKYETNKRAMEVLEEIYCKYEHSQSMLASQCLSVQNFMGKDFIYKMPKE